MAEEKKTQLGTTGRTNRPTGSQVAPAAPTPAPVVPAGRSESGPLHSGPAGRSESGPLHSGPAGRSESGPLHSGPAATPAPGHSTSYLPEQPDPLLGQAIAGRYLVVRKLGEGGMGAVYLATHNILEKQVALKVLHGEFARKPDLVERFIQEAKAASRIRHENVIDISDFGSTPEGLVFFAMELLQGHDLHDEVTRAKLSGHLLPWSRTKKIFLQICAALSAAHGKGIVHRDLKPENIYLIDFLGDADFVKLLDFGIAKLAETEAEGGRKLTKTGMLFGTPEYMSPEQARGEQVDHRVDIYAMGCILFQLVTGSTPFQADNFMGMLSMHLTEQPPTVTPETLDMIGAPRLLADVIDKALAKDRDQRWQTIDELAAAVREISGDPPLADRSQPMRAASVPAPAHPTRAKPPTGAIEPQRRPPTGTVERVREPTGRQKTQWTGNLHVPEVAAQEGPTAASRSKLPLVIGALVLAAGGAAAAFFLTRGHDTPLGDTVASGAPGSASVGSAPVQAPVLPPQPPPPPPEAPLPDMVAITLDSTPHGATVIDVATNKALGKTPYRISAPGSRTPRQYLLHLHGYGDSTVELPFTKPSFTYTEPLVKGRTAAQAVVRKVDDTGKALPADTSTAVTHPETATPTGTTAVKPPEPPPAGSAAVAVTTPDVPVAGSAAVVVKPPEPPPAGSAKQPDCPDDEMPCLKSFGSNH